MEKTCTSHSIILLVMEIVLKYGENSRILTMMFVCGNLGGYVAILEQHANRLLFWGFVAGFNEKYVTNVIDSIRQKSLH